VKIKTTAMAMILFLVIFGGIGTAAALGAWSTSSQKQPATFKEGEYAGQNNPADIRGSYTFTDISNSFGVDSSVLLAAFGFEADKDPAQTKAKDLEVRYAGLEQEIGTGSVRLFVALYKNLPADLDGTYLPIPAVQLILKANPSLSAEQKDYLASHQIELEPAAASTLASTPNESNTTQATTVQSETAQVTAATEPLVNGTATFQQVLDAGITQAQIEQVLGAPMPPTNQSVRDYCTNKGISFSTVKNALNALVPEK
jgi:hypothetical protein